MSEQSQNGVPWWRNDPWNGRHLFWENRGKFPAERAAEVQWPARRLVS